MTERTLVFATNNDHKLQELRRALGAGFRVLGLKDIGCTDDIPETGSTLEENALQKASWVRERYGYDCLADDTGLMVDALDGAPGVYSARYAGPGHDSAANMKLLLSNMAGKTDRKARFRTVIAMTRGDKAPLYFTGTVEGEILTEPRGEEGFGYDPVFLPEGSSLTFAEMDGDAKNAISHRGRAVKALLEWLAQN